MEHGVRLVWLGGFGSVVVLLHNGQERQQYNLSTDKGVCNGTREYDVPQLLSVLSLLLNAGGSGAFIWVRMVRVLLWNNCCTHNWREAEAVRQGLRESGFDVEKRVFLVQHTTSPVAWTNVRLEYGLPEKPNDNAIIVDGIVMAASEAVGCLPWLVEKLKRRAQNGKPDIG